MLTSTYMLQILPSAIENGGGVDHKYHGDVLKVQGAVD